MRGGKAVTLVPSVYIYRGPYVHQVAILLNAVCTIVDRGWCVSTAVSLFSFGLLCVSLSLGFLCVSMFFVGLIRLPVSLSLLAPQRV